MGIDPCWPLHEIASCHRSIIVNIAAVILSCWCTHKSPCRILDVSVSQMHCWQLHGNMLVIFLAGHQIWVWHPNSYVCLVAMQGNNVLGIVPSYTSLLRIDDILPRGMLAQANQSSYLVTEVANFPGQTAPSPKPSRPPLAVVGASPGPDASLALPPLTGLADIGQHLWQAL